MHIIFHQEHHFLLCQHTGLMDGQLLYAASNLKNATIHADGVQAEINYHEPGRWQSSRMENNSSLSIAEISLRPGGIIYMLYNLHRKKYIIRKSGKYGGRFDVLNRNKEEILTLLPSINWLNRGHEYSIQINEEYKNECTSLLILHAVHCANCLLGIINGSPVPALIDV